MKYPVVSEILAEPIFRDATATADFYFKDNGDLVIQKPSVTLRLPPVLEEDIKSLPNPFFLKVPTTLQTDSGQSADVTFSFEVTLTGKEKLTTGEIELDYTYELKDFH